MHRVVILGCGDAGLVAAAHLAGYEDIDVTVVSEREYHEFSYLLYHIIEGRPITSARLDLQRVFQGTDITFVRGLVEGLDHAERRVELRSGSLGFDTLLITLGGVSAYDIDDRRNVVDIRNDVRTIQQRIQSRDLHQVVVVGGGPVGVETSATLASVTDDAEIMLVSATPRLVSTFRPRASSLVEQELSRRDITLRLGTRVNDVAKHAVLLNDGSRVRSDLTIWAGGINPNPVVDSFDLPNTERGLCVDSSLRCCGTEAVFAAGDIVGYPDKINDGYAAGMEARTAAKNVLRRVRGRQLRDHSIRWHPRVVCLGGDTALFAMNGIIHSGRSPALLRAIASQIYTLYWKHIY